MVSKVYTVICSLFAITSAALFLTDNFTAITAIVLGFIAFGLVFMGMMFVLPYTITHTSPSPVKRLIVPKLPQAGGSANPPWQVGSQAHNIR